MDYIHSLADEIDVEVMSLNILWFHELIDSVWNKHLPGACR